MSDRLLVTTPVSAATLRRQLTGSLCCWGSTAPDGRLRCVFVSAPDTVLAAFDHPELVGTADELFCRDLVDSVTRVGTPGVVLALARRSSRADRRDLRVWHKLRLAFQACPVALIDCLIVSADGFWSAQQWHERRRPANDGTIGEITATQG